MKNRFNDYDEACGTCRFNIKLGEMLFCARNPPVAGKYPMISRTDDWCGEYKRDVFDQSIPKEELPY